MPHTGYFPHFGWRPVRKYVFETPKTMHTIDPLPCTFERTVRIISKWDLGQVAIRINNDMAAKYSYSVHKQGLLLAAQTHVHTAWGAETALTFTHGEINNLLIDMLLQKMGDRLRIISHAYGYTDTDNFLLFTTGGSYNAAGPYTQLDFINGLMIDMTGQAEFFETVDAF